MEDTILIKNSLESNCIFGRINHALAHPQTHAQGYLASDLKQGQTMLLLLQEPAKHGLLGPIFEGNRIEVLTPVFCFQLCEERLQSLNWVRGFQYALATLNFFHPLIVRTAIVGFDNHQLF